MAPEGTYQCRHCTRFLDGSELGLDPRSLDRRWLCRCGSGVQKVSAQPRDAFVWRESGRNGAAIAACGALFVPVLFAGSAPFAVMLVAALTVLAAGLAGGVTVQDLLDRERPSVSRAAPRSNSVAPGLSPGRTR